MTRAEDLAASAAAILEAAELREAGNAAMDQKLKELIERLKSAYGQRLISVILYGSAASGDADAEFSDMNVLCVLDRVDAKGLALSEPIFHWLKQQKASAPLLMDQRDVAVSTDCFPIEFEDMKDCRRVLYGEDVVATMTIDFSFYRARLEYELRSKLLRLRHQATPLLSNGEALVRLCADSVSTFLVLSKHALRIGGHSVSHRRREILAGLKTSLGGDFSAFEKLLDVREGKAHRDAVADPLGLFDNYMNQIHAVTDYVDGLEK
ncbi:MAG TPA: nucleotidyltransferase domain-containing protein [Bryobacteraceae bacterium]